VALSLAAKLYQVESHLVRNSKLFHELLYEASNPCSKSEPSFRLSFYYYVNQIFVYGVFDLPQLEPPFILELFAH
jgi:hypothetical protein